jgi:hypothetical protein
VIGDRVSAPVSSAVERRSTDLGLARVHLRSGAFALARTELETLAGRASLPEDVLVDLAEARWRTGEMALAGEAATTALDRGSEAPLAWLIAGEAAFALGRPAEARRLATRAMTAAGGTLDALFAGMPRSSVWPPDPGDPAPSAATLFGEDEPEPGREPARDGSVDRRAATSAALVVAGTEPAEPADPSNPGLWDEDAAPPAPTTPDPSSLLAAGLAALAADEPDRAATLLGLAMRFGPHLAPAIVDGTIDSTRPDVLMIRGDALRSTGREEDAVAAYAAAATVMAAPPGPEKTPVAADEPDPALQSGLTDPTPQ